MKNLGIVFAGLMLMASVTEVKGQTPDAGRKEVNWQVRGELGVSSLVGGVSNIDSRMGYAIGGKVDIALSKNGVWRIQPGLQLAQKGWAFEGYYGNEQIMAADYRTRLSYLDLPVQMAVRGRLGDGIYLTFRTGPYIAFGLNAKTKLSIRDTDCTETFGNHFSEACDFWEAAYDKENRRVAYPKLNRWELGWTNGIDLTVGHFIIGGNAGIDLTPVCDGNFMGNPIGNVLSSIFFGSHPKNFTLSLTLGYQL